MKLKILAFIISLTSIVLAEVEYGYFAPGNDGVNEVNLTEGERIVFLGTHDPYAGFLVTLPSGASFTLYGDVLGIRNLATSDGASPLAESRTIVGPCTLSLEDPSGSKYVAFKIFRPDSIDVTAKVMNIVSLPEDNDGDVDLLVETSTDLQNWTPVYSGSAGTSNSAAFFRTRLISP